MKPADIKLALEKRGIPLNPGVKTELIMLKAKAKLIRIDPYILSVFTEFNGFQKGALDPGSCVRIWPLEDIISQAKDGQYRIAFADFLINSNEYTFNLQDRNAPIFLDEEDTIVAEDFPDFLRQLLSGELDF